MKDVLHPSSQRRHGISWAPVLFLLIYLAALGLVAVLILDPLLHKAIGASPEERRRVSAYAALFVCILLLFLLVGLVFTMRIGRAARLRSVRDEHRPTEYPDAWQESARRLQAPAADDLEEDEGEGEGKDHKQ